METRPELMKSVLEGLQNEAAGTEEPTEAGASIEYVGVTLQEILQACMDERLTATRTIEIKAKRGRWMLKESPTRRFERGKRYTV